MNFFKNKSSYIYRTWVVVFLFCCMSLYIPQHNVVYGQNDPEFQIIPEADPGDFEEEVNALIDSETSWNFFMWYNKFARDLNEWWDKNDNCSWLGAQIASGIMNRDTILCMVSKLVRFIANMALVVWWLMMIYAGYSYAVAIFSNNSTVDSGGKAIKRAISGIVVIIFAYAILKFLISAFL